MSVSEARDHFSAAVNRAAYGGRVTYVTRGRSHTRAAAIVPAELLDELADLRRERDRARTRELMAADARGEVDWVGSRPRDVAELHRGLDEALGLE